MEFNKLDYKLFRQQIGNEVFKIPYPFEGIELCVALSGGLDSSCVVALYSKVCKNLRTYSIGFEDRNEFDKAEIVAKHFKTNHENIIINKEQYEETCKELINKKQEPLQVPNEALLYLVGKEFKKDIWDKKGIVLSGEGADEVFGGYTNILDTIPNSEGNLTENYLSRIVYDKELYSKLDKEQKQRYIDIFEKEKEGDFDYDIVQNWLLKLHLPALLQRLRIIRFVKDIDFYCPFLEPSWLLLNKILPREWRVNKTFLRIIFSRILPKEVLDAKKISFPLPLDINKWQEWNIEVWKNGNSNINFWK